MSRSFIHLRRVVFGTSCAVVFGFGATQALASPAQAAFIGCTQWENYQCAETCRATFGQFARSQCISFYGFIDCRCYEGPDDGIDP